MFSPDEVTYEGHLLAKADGEWFVFAAADDDKPALFWSESFDACCAWVDWKCESKS